VATAASGRITSPRQVAINETFKIDALVETKSTLTRTIITQRRKDAKENAVTATLSSISEIKKSTADYADTRGWAILHPIRIYPRVSA
jgi:hypothetical protein